MFGETEDIENSTEDVSCSDRVTEEFNTPHVYKSESGRIYLAHPPRSVRRALPNIFRAPKRRKRRKYVVIVSKKIYFLNIATYCFIF